MREIQNAAPLGDRWPIPVLNTTGEVVPPHAVMQIAGATAVGNDTLYHIIKPTGADSAKYLLNSPVSIDPNTEGFGTDFYPTTAATFGLPVVGQEWGPAAGSWLLAATGKGFLILGGAVTGFARVASIPPSAGQGADFPVIHLRNDSGMPKPKWSVFRTGVPLTPPPDSPIQPTFASLPPLEGKPFVISFADVGVDEENNIVDAAPVGIVAVQLNYTDLTHEKAECITGEYSKLKSVESGPATIQWRELQHLSGPASLGLQWAFVLLDRQGGAGGGDALKFTCAIQSSVPPGNANDPAQGSGVVYQVLGDGSTVEIGVRQIFNPFEFEISGNCSVGQIGENSYLVLGDIQAGCVTLTYVSDVTCVDGSIQVTKDTIKVLIAPCPS